MQGPMVGPAERDSVFITDPAAEAARLGKSQMMGVRGPSPADETRLRRHEPEVCAVTVAARFAECEGAFVDVPCHGIADPTRLPELTAKVFRMCDPSVRVRISLDCRGVWPGEAPQRWAIGAGVAVPQFRQPRGERSLYGPQSLALSVFFAPMALWAQPVTCS
jgi:hypothetical protein